MDPGRRRHPMVAPVLLEHRPEHLVEVFAAAADRTPKHALLRRAKLAEGAIGAPVLQEYTGLEAMRAERAEGERPHEAGRFQEDAAPPRPRVQRAFPFGGF